MKICSACKCVNVLEWWKDFAGERHILIPSSPHSTVSNSPDWNTPGGNGRSCTATLCPDTQCINKHKQKQHQHAENKQPTRGNSRKTVETVLWTCVCVCVCIPTVKLRPAAERGSANIQTLNTLHCTTAAAAAGLLSYMRETTTHTHSLTGSDCISNTHTHTAKGNQLWGSSYLTCSHSASQLCRLLSLSLPLSSSLSVQRCSVDRLICQDGRILKKKKVKRNLLPAAVSNIWCLSS